MSKTDKTHRPTKMAYLLFQVEFFMRGLLGQIGQGG